MTTLQRDIRMEVRQVLAKYGIDNLQMEIDLASVVRPFIDAGRMRVPQKRGDLVDFYATLAATNPELLERLKMRERVENASGRNLNWDDLKQDWNSFDGWLVDREKETGETIEQFMTWYRADDFRAKGVIYLTANKIKDWWMQAFEQDDRDRRHAL